MENDIKDSTGLTGELRPETAREMTYGEQAVGLTFNPGGSEGVAHIKTQCADIIDLMDKLRASTENGEVKRLASIAITEMQTAQMWAVKAITYKN